MIYVCILLKRGWIAVRRHIHHMKWLYIVFHKKFYFGLVRLDWIRLGFGLSWVGLGWVGLDWVGLAFISLHLATRTVISVAGLQIWVWAQIWGM